MYTGTQTIPITRIFLLIIFTCLTVFFFSSFTVHASTEIESLKADLTSMVNNEAFRSAHIGIAVQSLKNKTPLFFHNENKSFIAASNMKLYTAAAALLSLSPDFTYETKVMTNGAIVEDTLNGDLIIVASGDPTISGHFNNNNPTQVFENWADALIQKGIKKITGNIVIDNTYFNDSPFGTGWHWDDMSRCYSAAKDAFSFNNNCISLTISPDVKKGRPAKINVEPKTDYISLSGRVITGSRESAANIKAGYVDNSNNIVISGAIPLDHKNSVIYVAAKNPAEFGAYVLKETLFRKGIEINGNIVCTRGGCAHVKEITTEGKISPLTTLALYRSPKLSEIIKVVNKISNNLYAENLLLTIAKETGNEGNSKQAILSVIEILKKAGFNPEGFYMADGSGLSRFNLITPRETIQLLEIMNRSSYAELFLDSLAVPGEEGTLRNRQKGASPVTLMNIRAKTGTLTQVRNFSGYIRTVNGELLAFSLLCNNYKTPVTVIDNLYDRILARLAIFGSSGSD